MVSIFSFVYLNNNVSEIFLSNRIHIMLLGIFKISCCWLHFENASFQILQELVITLGQIV